MSPLFLGTTQLSYPGIHNLDTTLAISEIHFFSMDSASSETVKVVISCAMTVCFQFVSVVKVHVHNLSLRGFVMTESIHSRSAGGNSNVAIIVKESKLYILRCYFDNFSGFEWLNEVSPENTHVHAHWRSNQHKM